MDVRSLDGIEVEIPRSAASFADKAERAGWTVMVTTTYSQEVGNDLEPLYEIRREAKSVEEGEGYRQIVTDIPKMVATVAVRCRRDRDYLFAIWANGAFSFACRPRMLQTFSSTEATAHLTRSLDEHRWLPTRRGLTAEVCVHHAEIREVVPA